MIERLQAVLGDRYRVTAELGGGGMSRVFDAVDPSLDRRVAIKVLPPELAADVEVERFRREVQVAAKLQHPHIVPLLASGTSDGILWYAMPFVDGESLRAKLDREGGFPTGDAIRLWRELLDALGYAHQRGIVHRDIKPENLMLSGGHLQVTDFGIARALSADGGARLTQSGLLVGTPAYMAPEQAAGDAHADHRADLYSAALIAYEMLAGRPPFSGSTPQRLMSAHAIEPPPPLRSLRPAVPETLAALIHHGLEKDPADRPQDAASFLVALEQMPATSTPSRLERTASLAAPAAAGGPRRRRAAMLGVLALATLLGAGALWTSLRPRGGPTGLSDRARDVIEVARFDGTNVSDAELDAITQAVRSDLALGLRVTVPDNAARATLLDVADEYVQGLAEGRFGRAEVAELARRTAMKGYVYGSVTRLGDGFLVEATLADAAGDSTLANARAEADGAGDLRAAVRRVTDQLLTAADRAIPTLPEPLYLGFATTTSRAALHLWASANQVRSSGDWLSPVISWREALRLDSTFALAALSLTNSLHSAGLGAGEIGRGIALAESRLDSLPARERDSARWTLAYAKRDRLAMLQLGREVLARSPNSAGAFNRHGLALRDNQRFDEAIASFGSALRINPEYRTAWGNLAASLVELSRKESLDSLLRADSAKLERWGGAEQAVAARYRGYLRGDLRAGFPHYERIVREDTSRLSLNVQRSANTLRLFHAVMGQLRAAEGHAATEDTLFRGLALPGDRLRSELRRHRIRGILTGQERAAVDSLDRALAAANRAALQPLDRKHAFAALEYAMLGDAVRARRELEEYRRSTPRNLALRDTALALQAAAEVALVEGRWTDALGLAAMRESQRPCYGCTAPLVARAHVAAGRPDSAIAVLERYQAKLAPWSYDAEHEVPRTMRLLAELYEAKGDRARAVHWHERFIELWKDADAELQPLVEASRGRVRALRPAG